MTKKLNVAFVLLCGLFSQTSHAVFSEYVHEYYKNPTYRKTISSVLKDKYGDVATSSEISVHVSGMYHIGGKSEKCTFPHEEGNPTVGIEISVINGYYVDAKREKETGRFSIRINAFFVPEKILQTGDIDLIKEKMKSVKDVVQCFNGK